jgi:polysaccharide pyruvyl transferase WcaK-like protein/MoaA/NifB/PqqE/SkfB family radical SAM enzyme
VKARSILRYGARIVRGLRLLGRSAWYKVREDSLGQYWPVKPTVIQFPINDICNAHCVMCNIWKKKRDKELTPDELRQILADPLFASVTYASLNGGEPTLRKDLAELGRALVETLPRLRALGVITNALRVDEVTERILALADVVCGRGRVLYVQVSLDGVGADHDLNRGVRGNFAAAVEVIDRLRKKNVPVSIGCTLTPLNCYGADDLLLWCQAQGITGYEFRLGVEIKRVYNEGLEARLPWSREQSYHLIGFFDRLAHESTTPMSQRLFYRSLVGQMALGRPRSTGCDWRARGVTLDTRGNISYCSVQSPILGSALEKSAWRVFREGLPVRRQILQHSCGDCRHDLQGMPPLKEALRELRDTAFAPWRSIATRLRQRVAKSYRIGALRSPRHERPAQWSHVLITGWYGTETSGDKAILAEVVYFLRSRRPDCRITLTTMDEVVSRQTQKEFAELSGCRLVSLESAATSAILDDVDAVVIGGGPLEEIDSAEYLLRLFIRANRLGKARIIFGCGVGPLHSERLRQITAGILRLATAGFVRDVESLELASQLTGHTELAVACDPALGFLQRWQADQFNAAPTESRPLTIAGLLRANTGEYVSGLTASELDRRNAGTAKFFGDLLGSVARTREANVHLLPMHTHWRGGDDRQFNREVAAAAGSARGVTLERAYLTLPTLLEAIHKADAAVAMRYHGHLFCLALGVPFLSIDYTGPNNKVAALLRRIGWQEWSQDWRSMQADRARLGMDRLLEARLALREQLRHHFGRLTTELYETYEKVFGAGPARAQTEPARAAMPAQIS